MALRSEEGFSRGRYKCWERKDVLGRKNSLRKGKEARTQLDTAKPPGAVDPTEKKMLLVSFIHLRVPGPSLELTGTKHTCLERWMDEATGISLIFQT